MNLEKKSKIGKNISFLYRRSQMYINNELSKYDINSSEYMYILAIFEDKKVSLGYLSNELAVDPALTTKVVNSLVKKGFVEKERSATDKRSFEVILTQKGREVKPIIYDVVDNWTKIMMCEMKHEDVEYISEKLEQIRDNITSKE